MGAKYVEKFLSNYDNINRGIPIGGIVETMTFINLIERIKEQI